MTALNTRPRIDTDRFKSETMKIDYAFWFSDDLEKWIGKGTERRRGAQERFRAKKVAKRQVGS
jgi:hypothetical protein